MIACCFWCHAVQPVEGPTTCRFCFHRADLAKADCDCGKCRPRSVEQCVLDADDTDLYLGGAE